MMTGHEVRGLLQAMQAELNVRISTVFKCALMLALVFGLMWGGSSSEPLADHGTSPAVAKITTAASESYSRKVFAERRQRYIEVNPDSHVAREAASLQQKDANSDGGYFAGHSE
jgi:hypothetical protein